MENEPQPSTGVGVGVDNLGRGHGCSTADQSGNAAELADIQLVRAPGATGLVKGGGVRGEISVVAEPENGEVKRKRGRPPRSQGKVGAAAGSAAKKNKKEEENVCFICFDGGTLVLCDRRDCPKAYHPACVKRDEAFFRGRVRWNCGWHLCNICQKSAFFMCYTCPYSLCKGCVKQADVLSVRGNKGLCRTCMTTIMLIENVAQGSKEVAQVDFDDKSSWEYLFKVYWVYLKQKESLSVDELTSATNPWKGLGLDQKANCLPKMHVLPAGIGSESSCTAVQLEANASKRRKTRKQLIIQSKESQSVEHAIDPEVSRLHDNAEWASKDLLEFVAHMKNGDTSMLSQFDVQALLLEYIRKHNLRDPRRKCQIICDWRLENLFGKAHVGHFEMLKLLEYHFKEESRASSAIQGAADSMAGQGEAMGSSEDTQTMSRERKRQTRKKGDDQGLTNVDSYAAIDLHNISLIYLKRNVMESLIQDAEKFHNKVVGSVVRIKIPGNDQKADMYRLVRVVGTRKVAEAHKIGDKTSNVMLKILNLNKTEDVAIDGISNQEFTEDECARLRQSIKCGFAQRMTVGEIQEKAIALQAVRVNDCLEAEILRLNHLRDRASEMGHRKKLRECVEKLELLNTSAERQNRLREIPEVHADPRMNPGYESDDTCGQSDLKKQDLDLTPKHLNLNAKGAEDFAPTQIGTSPYSLGSKIVNIALQWDQKRKSAGLQIGKEEASAKHSERPHQSSQRPVKANAALRVLDELRNRVDPSIKGSKHAPPSSGSFPGLTADSSPASVATGVASASALGDFDNIWHYQDPSGRVQGPFCMLLLRKWSSNGYFPTDLRVWRINENQDKSILLTEALTSVSRFQHNSESQFQVAENKSDYAAEFVGELSSNCDSAVRSPTPLNEGGSPGLTCAVPGGQASNGLQNGKKSGSYGSESGKNQKYLPGSRTLVCGLPSWNPTTVANSAKNAVLNAEIKNSVLTLRLSEVANKDPKDHSVDKEQLCALSHPQKNISACQNASSSCTGFSDMSSCSLKPKLDNVDLNVQANESDDPGGLTVAACNLDTKNNSGISNVGEHNWTTKSSSAFEDVEIPDLGTKPSVASGDVETSSIPNQIPNSEPDTMNMSLQGRESIDVGTSSDPEHDGDFGTKLGPDSMDINVRDEESLDNGAADVPACDVGTKSSCVSSDTEHSGQQSPSKSEPDTMDARLLGRESGTSDVSNPDVGDKKSSSSGDVEFCDLPITDPKPENDAPIGQSVEVKLSVDLNVHGQDSGSQWGNWSGKFETTDMSIADYKANYDGLKSDVLETKQHVGSNIPGRGSGISCCTSSSHGCEVHLPEGSCEWNQSSQGQNKISVEELDSDLASGCLLKLTEAVSNYATLPQTCQLTVSSPAHPECCTSRWLAMEPIELSTLGDESVSDLLSEVEALESLKLLSSPTSRMNSEADPIGSPQSDCFSPLVGLSPHLDPGKHDMKFHSHPAAGDELQRGFQVDVQSTPSPEIEAELDKAFASIQEEELASEANSPAQQPASIEITKSSSSLGLECNAKPAYALMHHENKSISQAPPTHWLSSSTSLNTFLRSGVEEELKPSFSGVPPQGVISQAQPSTALAAATVGLISSNGLGVVGGPKPPTIPLYQHVFVSRSSSTVLSPSSPSVGVPKSHGDDGAVKPSISVHGYVPESPQPAIAFLQAARRLDNSGSSREVGPGSFSVQKEALVSEDHPPESPLPSATTVDALRSPQGEEGFIPVSNSLNEEAVVYGAPLLTSPLLLSLLPPSVNRDSSRSDGVEGTMVQRSVSMHQAGSISEVHQPSTLTRKSLPSPVSAAEVAVVTPPVSMHRSSTSAAEVVSALTVSTYPSMLSSAGVVVLPPVSTHQSSSSAAEEGVGVPPLVSAHQSSVSAVKVEVVPPLVSMHQTCTSAAEEGELVPLLVSKHQSSASAAGVVVPPPVSTHQSELVSPSHLPIPETKIRDVTSTVAPGRPGLLPTPQTTTRDAAAAVALGRPGFEDMDSSRGTCREISNMSGIELERNNQGINSGNTDVHHRSNPVANQGVRAIHQQPRHTNNAGRNSGPKDGNYHHQGILDSGFGRGKPSWNRQPSFGSGGSSRQPPYRGKRICKFYGSGYCRKGATCNYLHP